MISARKLLTGIGLAGLLVCAAPSTAFAEETGYSPPSAAHDQIVKGMSSAKSLYALKCSGCHRMDGMGAPEAGIPPFPGFIAPLARNQDGRVYIAHVPGIMGSRLSNDQLADVLNYVIDEWSEDTSSTPPARFTAEELTELREVRLTNIVEFRRNVVAQLSAAGDPVADYPWP